ncbi:MAG: hypothetical protein NZ781_11865 [Armatimonadetes bacterium]|nr:hypothetical protein [Armatimonadota bacterium]
MKELTNCRFTFSRREFLGIAAGAIGAITLKQSTASSQAAAELPKLQPVRVFCVFAGRTGHWYLTRPAEEIPKFRAFFSELEKRLETVHGSVKFIGEAQIPPEDAEKVAKRLQEEADALLIIHLSGHGGEAPVLTKLVEIGLPTVVFSQPFSGHGWMYFPQWRKAGHRVVLVASSDWADLEKAIALLRAPVWMKQSKILAVGRPHGTAEACKPENVKKAFGTDLVIIPNERIHKTMTEIDPKEAEAEAEEYWIRPAKAVVEPKRQEIIQSARMFLAVKRIMSEERAHAICSIHCMGDPRGCLTFSKLNDMGYVGGCEGDIDSTLTMLIFAYAFGVPGFISDPVIDVAKNAMIHFHCTSATKMYGPKGERLPFVIRSQTDSGAGVSLEVENRIGQPVTCAKLVHLDKMLFVTGKILWTSKDPLACRTQFAQSVPDARSLFLRWGEDVIRGDVMTLLHRVVFYGDYADRLRDLAALMNFRLIEEGKGEVV